MRQGANGAVTGFDLAKDIKIPFLGLFGEMVRAHNPNVEILVYPGAGHGFHADYRPSYNKAAADDAWNRCVGWFNKNLKG